MPTPMPRPVTIFALEIFAAALRGVHFAALRDSVENSEPAHVGHVALAKFVGIDTGEIGKLIDGLFRREGEGKIQGRAQPAAFQVLDATGSLWFTSFRLAISYMPPQVSGLTP